MRPRRCFDYHRRMKEGPSIAPIAALAGDPARANMLAALLAGKALTATELANEAGVTAQTASSHLGKLEAGGLVDAVKQGRHRYFRLAGADVAEMLESMMGVAARAGHLRTRPGPADPALRRARVCYDHLAGEMGVRLMDGLVKQGRVTVRSADVRLTQKGEAFAGKFGIDLEELTAQRRPLCRPCLDWSMRENHMGGAFGAAMLERIYGLGWARREKRTRVVRFTPTGEAAFVRLLRQ